MENMMGLELKYQKDQAVLEMKELKMGMGMTEEKMEMGSTAHRAMRILPLEDKNVMKMLVNSRCNERPLLIEDKSEMKKDITFYLLIIDPIDRNLNQSMRNTSFRVLTLEGVRLTRYQDPLCDQSLMEYQVTHIWKYVDLIEILRKLRKYTKKFLAKNQPEYKQYMEDTLLKFSMECDFRLSLLILSSIPYSDHYGAFICSISYSLTNLERRVCTPVNYQDTREIHIPNYKHPLTYSIHNKEQPEISMNILSNLQFILSCTRVSSRVRNYLSSPRENEETMQLNEYNSYLDGISCFFGESIQRANKREILLKKKKKSKDKIRKKKKQEESHTFIPHYLNKNGYLYPLNYPIEIVPKQQKSFIEKSLLQNQIENERSLITGSSDRFTLEVDSQLDDSGTMMSMIIGEDFSVKMHTKQMIKFSLLMCAEGEDGFSNGFIWNDFIPHYKCKNFKLSEGATKILVEPNAGGNSYHSEILSFELMKRIFNARLENTEMEIEYDPFHSKKTDYSCIISDSVFGVSVTRAMKYGADDDFSIDDAIFLLKKKLYGILISTKNVVKEQQWNRQILHIWCATRKIANVIQYVWKLFKKSDHHYHHLTGNTIIMCTIADAAPYVFHGREELPDIPHFLF
eukprot:TRINITY_DN4715_c0_g1_i1.p1 TRINITY_DN4715_c0_g1~~TRINITY_DN4715_c0_g1_i1.p1  ORF type:complete len:628 (-),score=130.35 TRINITY_DN4715_c0_g1_i1:34-1917(-)